MKELMEYREKLLARLSAATDEFCQACRAAKDSQTTSEWDVHQIAFHIRDIEREVYGMRIRRTLSEDNPEFKSFDPDVWMSEQYNRDEPLEKILGEFTQEMHEVCSVLQEMPVEGWSRLSCHEALGKELTLQLWVERSLAHLQEHLNDLPR